MLASAYFKNKKRKRKKERKKERKKVRRYSHEGLTIIYFSKCFPARTAFGYNMNGANKKLIIKYGEIIPTSRTIKRNTFNELENVFKLFLCKKKSFFFFQNFMLR